ncbi:MAG: class I SAM-dependent rRNA methyltransferase [Thermoanaerobaculia bacterium]|nr:class I SAM-dependent rRNA methyltransferase [Thermoanaerobaculia bacterium]
MKTLTIRKGREKSLQRRHPWVFSGAVASVSDSPSPGESVRVVSSDGKFFGWGMYSPASKIRVRIASFDEDRPIDEGLIRARVRDAVESRSPLSTTDAMRLVFSESDELPGLIADRYGDFLVCQFLTAGAETWKETIADELDALLSPEGIFERSDSDVRSKEGLEPRTGVLRGKEPPELVEIQEAMTKYYVDVRNGHKTGFYLDQRENRAAVALFSRGRRALNCFSYSGGFGIAAASGGAESVVNVDVSGPALELARENAKLNRIEPERFETVEADVFEHLRLLRDRGDTFDLIVLDPPKFAESRRTVDKACRGYKDINLLAFKLLGSGGLLFTFSCSGAIDAPLFQKVVAGAAVDAKRHARILRTLDQPSDHPVSLAMPEGRYLKGLIVQV